MARRFKPEPLQDHDAQHRAMDALRAVIEDLREVAIFLDPALDDGMRLVDIEYEVHRVEIVNDAAGNPIGARMPVDLEALARLIARARGDKRADLAVREFAATYLRNTRSLPPDMADYVADSLVGKRPKFKTNAPDHQFHRHIGAVVAAVEKVLALDLGFKATREHRSESRAREGQKDSACSVVATALAALGCNIPESTVQREWLAHRRRSKSVRS